MSYPSTASQSSSTTVTDQSEDNGVWRQQLAALCQQYALGEPKYELASDRRGGRTAWSCSVTIAGRIFQARYWYDGSHVEGAREDAAHEAFHLLRDWIGKKIQEQAQLQQQQQQQQQLTHNGFE